MVKEEKVYKNKTLLFACFHRNILININLNSHHCHQYQDIISSKRQEGLLSFYLYTLTNTGEKKKKNNSLVINWK